jgi:hypothetical protein
MPGCKDPDAHLDLRYQLSKFREHQADFRDLADKIAAGSVVPDGDGRYAVPPDLRRVGLMSIQYLPKLKVVLFEFGSHPIDAERAFGRCYDAGRADPIEAIRDEWHPRKIHQSEHMEDGWFLIVYD